MFNNIGNKFENIPKEYKDNISFISKHIKNKVFLTLKYVKKGEEKDVEDIIIKEKKYNNIIMNIEY